MTKRTDNQKIGVYYFSQFLYVWGYVSFSSALIRVSRADIFVNQLKCFSGTFSQFFHECIIFLRAKFLLSPLKQSYFYFWGSSCLTLGSVSLRFQCGLFGVAVAVTDRGYLCGKVTVKFTIVNNRKPQSTPRRTAKVNRKLACCCLCGCGCCCGSVETTEYRGMLQS